MMLGGGLMMVLGLLFSLMLIGIPILLVIVLAGGAAGFLIRKNDTPIVYQQPVNTSSKAIVQSDQTVAALSSSYPRYCAHCGAGVQAGWMHCPQCGAPISSIGQ